MSWSISTSGTVSEVVKVLDGHSANLQDQSKVEYDAALPHLKALVEQNFRKQEGATEPKVSLSANGSGTSVDGEQRSRECSVALRVLSLIGIMLAFTSTAFAQAVKPVQEVQVQKESQVQKDVPLQSHKEAVQAPVQKHVVYAGTYSGECGAGRRARGGCGILRGTATIARGSVSVAIRPIRGVHTRRSGRVSARAEARAGYYVY